MFGILIDNAIRYSDEDSTVSVDVGAIEGQVQINVCNTGSVLTDADTERVFERFFRSDSAVRRSEGSGLGLPVAKAIVEAHKGTIELEHSDGRILVSVKLPGLCTKGVAA